ncbi:MAG: C40 family peptidase [Clostridiales bacterium]|nr:C40 family peptidase [Clostridiales bacterium]
MMKKAVMQFTACCLAVGITLGSFGTVALADNNRSMTLAGLSETNTVVSSSSTLAGLSETDTVVGTGGAQDATTATEDTAAQTADETADAAAAASETDDTASDAMAADTGAVTADVGTTSEETEVQTETEAVYDTSLSGELAFAQCENYINVRAEASVDGEVVGKVYNNGSVTILGQLGDWYEVQSGNVTGYVNAAYFAIGEEADEIAEAVAYNVATVNAEGLWVHSEASEDSSTIGMVYSSDQLEVVAYEGDWMKVVLEDGTYGYINAWYVSYDTYYSTAETLEEEQQRLDEQWLAYLAEQEAEAAAAQAAEEAAAAEAAAAQAAAEAAAAETSTYTETYTETYTDSSSTTSSSSTSLSEAQAAVDEAYQTYLEAQEAADAATQQADEQLVYDTYDEAVAAYQDYLSAVAVADELKYSSTTDTSSSTITTTDTTTSETTYTEATASTETTYTEAAQTEAVQTEAPQTEAAETTSTEASTTTTSTSSSSSTGQSIANYAVQFVGNPYVYGGTSLTNGADCSGFTQSVFANFGISIPRTAAAQASSGTAVSLSDIQAGDLLFYSDGSGISHVALYIGNGQVVHASTSSTGIIISSYNYRTPVCARRYWS